MLGGKHKKLVAEGLQFNSYFAQHEVVLASTMGSQDQGERQEAFDIIASLRKKEKRSNRKTVRKVKNPQVNLHASKLSEMVNLKKATSSPPLFFPSAVRCRGAVGPDSCGGSPGLEISLASPISNIPPALPASVLNSNSRLLSIIIPEFCQLIKIPS